MYFKFAHSENYQTTKLFVHLCYVLSSQASESESNYCRIQIKPSSPCLERCFKYIREWRDGLIGGKRAADCVAILPKPVQVIKTPKSEKLQPVYWKCCQVFFSFYNWCFFMYFCFLYLQERIDRLGDRKIKVSSLVVREKERASGLHPLAGAQTCLTLTYQPQLHRRSR